MKNEERWLYVTTEKQHMKLTMQDFYKYMDLVTRGTRYATHTIAQVEVFECLPPEQAEPKELDVEVVSAE